MRTSLFGLATIFALAQLTAAADPPTCSLDRKCPKEFPCCSQYGQCGKGAYCLGGCDARMSHTLDSCVPAPVCEDRKIKMDSMDRVVDIAKYYGDPSKADWVSQGSPAVYKNNMILTMPPDSVGTVLASTVYMWYGSVKAKLKTSRGAGVVTAFILMSDVKDEIDYEWVGVDLNTAQTNYYFQGIPNYTQGGNITIDESSYDTFHEYEIQWTPDEIKWLVDGKVGRTKKRSETWNATANQWNYPQTPSRVQLSIWPGGAASNLKGTIDWAGGPIDWDSEDIKRDGYYYATFSEVEIKCFNADSAPGTNKGVSYTIDDIRATNDTVTDGKKKTIIKSFEATGTDMDKTSKKDKDNSGEDKSTNYIPGGSSSGNSGVDHADSNDDGTNSNRDDDCADGDGFTQSCGSNKGDDENEGVSADPLGASALAAVVALYAFITVF